MAHRKRKPKWSFFLIRDADQRVRQFQVSGRAVVLLPVAAAFTLAGCFTVWQIQTLNHIHDLEARLAHDSIQHKNSLEGKNSEMNALTSEFNLLNGQTERLKEQLSGLSELEQRLRQFLGKYGEGVPQPSNRDASSTAVFESTITDFSELSQMLDEMAVSMESSLRKSVQKQAELDAIPSGWPTVARRLTSGFGFRRDPMTGKTTFHAGVDISGDTGDPIYAAGDGKVKESGFNRTRGNYIIITHRNGLESWYMHLSQIGVKIGDQLKRGDIIGKMGNSGRSTGTHLHFQIVVSEEPVNPLPYLRQIKED
ncbi:M23 family metallopeptidase [Cohnella abietis]|uniref:M23ase beta-sheet core domain-containing protein n=1 Tax=Cohnella abietis TaxID=2507935 RepID=A0A3T1D123_9BACL|nr:peptidoglycan DD-metalloendopeptidase family protein [Cohnella abietis]BBI31812.1 hypothetical protein KCTCHS21_12110 [Cohnella abietis]